jgi:hypothetical protein
MTTELSDMDISSVHLVGKAATRQKYLIVKNMGGTMAKTEDELKAEQEAKDKFAAMKKSEEEKAEQEALAKAEKEKDDAAKAELTKTAEDAKAALTAKNAALIKSAIEILKASDSDEAKEAVAALEASVGDKKVEKGSKTTTDEVTSIMKGLLPEITKSIEEPLRKSLDEARAEVEEIKKSNALLIGEKVNREITDIAKNLVGDTKTNEDYLRLMKSKLSDAEFDIIVKREKDKTEETRKGNLFKEAGSTSYDSSSGDSAYAKLSDIANGLIQKSTEQISFNDAFSKAVAERPDLYDEYRNGSYANKVREE